MSQRDTEQTETEAERAMARLTTGALVGTWLALACGCRWRRMFPWVPQWHVVGCPYGEETP